MSWDVLILNVAAEVKSAVQLNDQSARPLGTRPDVLQKIRQAFPNLDVTDPKWIVIIGADYSIQASLVEDDVVQSILLNVHGSAQALDAIGHLCDVARWRAFDSATGEFIDFNSQHKDMGWQRARNYTEQTRNSLRKKQRTARNKNWENHN
jgi:hypothetical protein